MLRVSIFVLLIATALVDLTQSVREDDESKEGKVQLSVNHRSFAKIHGADRREDDDEKVRARGDDEEDSEVAAKAEHRAKVQRAVSQARRELQEALVGAENGLNGLSKESGELRQQAQEASHGMLEQRANVEDSQQAEATVNLAQKAFEMTQSAHQEEARAEARAHYEKLAKQRRALVDHADDLEKEMHQQYQAMLSGEAGNVASLLSVSEEADDDMTEEEQFKELELQTQQIMRWFDDLKGLRSERDEMLKHKKLAEKHGLALGLEADFVNRELQHDAFGNYPYKFPKAEEKKEEPSTNEESWAKGVVEEANNDKEFQADRLAHGLGKKMSSETAAIENSAADAATEALDIGVQSLEEEEDEDPPKTEKLAQESKSGASEATKLKEFAAPASEHKAPAADPFGEDQRRKLAAVMASSAIEMAQIKSASDDVLTALDDLTEWKKRADDSTESDAHALKVQARLSKAMGLLQEHEHAIKVHSKQIHQMMRDAGMKNVRAD